MHPDIFDLCEIAGKLGARVTILSTGLLLARYAKEIIEHVDDVIVSLDGPAKGSRPHSACSRGVSSPRFRYRETHGVEGRIPDRWPLHRSANKL